MTTNVIIQPWGGQLPEGARYINGTKTAEITLRRRRFVDEHDIDRYRPFIPSFRVPGEDEPEVRTVMTETVKVIEDELQGTIKTFKTQYIETVSTRKSSKVFKSSELIRRTYVGDSITPSITRLEPLAREMSAIELHISENYNAIGAIGYKKPSKYLFPVQDPPLQPRNRMLAFTDLAPEIRNTIYKYLLVTPKVVANRYGNFPLDPSQVSGTHYYEQGTMLSLRKTCRLIYEEGTELVYGHTFVFRDHNDLSGFLSQLTPALPSLPRKVFKRVVLHIGQDQYRITATCNLPSENSGVHEVRDTMHYLPIQRKECKYALAQGWSQAIVTLLHQHQVQHLVLVAGSSNRALLTTLDPAKPLMRNLLASTFHVDNLTILDSNPDTILSDYKLPRKLKALWESTEFSLDRYNPNWNAEDEVLSVLSADEEDAESTDEGIPHSADEDDTESADKDDTGSGDQEAAESADEEVAEPADEEVAEATDEEIVESADEEGPDNNPSTDTDNGSNEHSGSNEDVNQYQSASLTENARSSEDPGSVQPTMEIGGDMRIRAGALTTTAKIANDEEFMATLSNPTVPCHFSTMPADASNYGYIESIGEPVSGQKRTFSAFMEDLEPQDVAVQAVPEWMANMDRNSIGSYRHRGSFQPNRHASIKLKPYAPSDFRS